MQEFVIPRTGFPSVRFNGDMIAEAVATPPKGRAQWYELRLYRTESGKLVLHIGYRSTWHPRQLPQFKEMDHDEAIVFEDIHQLPERLREHRGKIESYCKTHPKAPPRTPEGNAKVMKAVAYMFDDLSNRLVTAAVPSEQID